MNVGISTASIFNKAMVEDTPPLLSAMGCRTIEVFLNTFSEYRPDFVRLLRERIDDAGLIVYSVHPMSNQDNVMECENCGRILYQKLN